METILIDGQELEKRLGDPTLVLLDARPVMEHLFAHIPGTVHISWKEFRDPHSDSLGLLDPDLARLGRRIASYGVGDQHHVIVYGDPTKWGDEGRVCWMLRYLGHPSTRVLDGGFPKWKAEGRPVERGPVKARAAVFTPRLRPGLGISKGEIARRIAGPRKGFVVIDARTVQEYRGATSAGIPRGGHIPGAINVPWNMFYRVDGTVNDPAMIREALEQREVGIDDEVVTYCTGGVRCSFLFCLLVQAGYRNVRNYAGSWWEWSRDPSLPVEK